MSLSKLVVVLAITTASTAHAGDSTWLLCKGTGQEGSRPTTPIKIVTSLLEHRGAAEPGDTRDLEVTLIAGDHVARGSIVGAKAGDFTAKAAALELELVTGKQPLMFTGTALLAPNMKSIKLTGKLDADLGDAAKPTMTPFTAKLTCETL